MVSVLEEICNRKRAHVAAQKAITPLSKLQSRANNAERPRGFLKSIKSAHFPAMITEVKKASPSKGIIRADFDPVSIAKIYEASGATCISVLTDEPYFQGNDNFLIAVKEAVKIPVLRKDFMIDEYQIIESRALGADCVLLIMAALSDDEAKNFHDLSKELGMDVLVEVHDEEELERAIKLAPEMIGINNRNLKTLAVDTQISFELVNKIPDHCLKISESGLSNFDALQKLGNAGFSAFLVGESLMREDDISQALWTLTGKPLTHKVN